jgi:hypothetical protein
VDNAKLVHHAWIERSENRNVALLPILNSREVSRLKRSAAQPLLQRLTLRLLREAL